METLLRKKEFWRNLVLFTALSFTTVIFGKTGLVDNNLDYFRASPTIYSDIADYYPGDSKLIATTNGLSSGLHAEVIFKAPTDKPTATVLTRTSGTNPSACGGSVTFTATVTNTGTGNNNPKCGSVTFLDGATEIGSVNLNNDTNNVATLTISSLSPGVTHSITAVYSPNSSNCNFVGSTSAVLLHIVNAPPIAVFSTPPTDITVSCGTSTATSSLSYSNSLTGLCGISGSVTSTQSTQIPSGICGGVITETWSFTDAFSRPITHRRTITVSPPGVASFDPVSDITVDCGAATTSPLAYTNGKTGDCEIKGSVTSTLSVENPAEACGEDITETWTYTDACNRTITASRIIHVSPTAVASFAAVSDITVDCGAATASSLDYTNGKTGGCEIKGSVMSTLSVENQAEACGEDITETWTYTDACNRTITASRIIHISPTAVASFAVVNDITVDCGAATTSSLSYTNDKTGGCAISGTVTSTLSVENPAGYCGGDITESWTYADSCNRTIMTSRTIHVRPIEVASEIEVVSEYVPCLSGSSGVPKVYLCHKTGSSKNPCINICVDQSAVAAHLAHGDYLGECAPNCENRNATPTKQVGGENVALFNVNAYPNPSNNQFIFEIESERSDNISIRILDISGRLIKEMTDVKESKVIFGESLQRGVYIAIVQQGNNQQTIRIVKE